MKWPPLAVEDPPKKGRQVKTAQHVLAHNVFRLDFRGGSNGVADAIFGAGVYRAKEALGYPDDELTPVFDDRLYAYLTGTIRLPLSYRLRRRSRLKKGEI